MSLIEIIAEKFKAQNKYSYDITLEKNMSWCFRLGDAVCMVDWRAVETSDQPTQEVKHTEECIRKQSIVCPQCGALVLVEKTEIPYEGTYWDAFCKECHCHSDNDRIRITEWLEENDYYYTCDCPMVEIPPQAPWLAEHIYKSLFYKNEKMTLTVGGGKR